MRYLSASFIFPIYREPVKDGILVTDDSGKILDLLDPLQKEIPSSLPIEKFTGIICPGFVNTHCHLELSHLKGKFTQKKGLSSFIGEMVEKRVASDEQISFAMKLADDEMYSEGIVAVGDISNNFESIEIKSKSKIFYHSFIELFDIFPDRADAVFEKGVVLSNEFNKKGLRSSLVPHAPYTVSKRLLNLIVNEAMKSESILCIHNQETESENEMFIKGTGSLIEKLQKLTGAYKEWIPSGKTSLSTIIESCPPGISLQLVHNTFTNLQDVRNSLIENQWKLYWCLCLNANQFIENSIPDLKMLVSENCRITIGTDSYASNISLSILNELKTINNFFPDFGLEVMLPWATLNGAAFLRVADIYGSFEKGKTPGINLISNIDFQGFRLKVDSQVRKLL